MKKTFLGVIGIVGMMLFAGCDKIESGEYTVYDGAVVNWSAGSAIANPVQRAFVEKYTGPKCNNCPKADETLDALANERLVVVSVNHPTGQGVPYSGQPDMRTDGGSAWDTWLGINAIPAAYLNRDRSTQFLGVMGNLASAVDEALAAAPTVAMEVSAMGSSTVNVAVDLQFMSDYKEPLTLTVVLVEDSLAYKQLLPDGTIDDDYVHNHMLRKVITGFWGREIEASGNAGEALRGTLSFTPASDIQLRNSHIVAFVSDKSSRRILNCASCHID